MPSKAGLPFDRISNWCSDLINIGRADAKKELHWSSKPNHTRILMRRIRAMTQLTSLVVGCYPTDSSRYFMDSRPLWDAAWSHSRRLQNLTLHLPLECFRNVLATIPRFRVLESLSLSIWNGCSDPLVCTSTLAKLAKFINRHSASLTHLTIDIPTSDVDPSPLFYNVEQLPRLIGASIKQPLQDFESDDIGIFLSKHRINLQELSLEFYESAQTNQRPTPGSFFSNSIFQVGFPSITSLDLGLCYWNKGSESLLAHNLAHYLSKFGNTLSRLTIRGCILSLPIVDAFVSTLEESANLRELKMDVHCLSADLLDVLAHKLPRLRSLDLTYSWFRYKDDGCWDPDLRVFTEGGFFAHYVFGECQQLGQEFLTRIGGHDYSPWSLGRLQVTPREMLAGYGGDIRKMLSACLRSVHTVNGIPRRVFDNSQRSPSTPLYFLPVENPAR